MPAMVYSWLWYIFGYESSSALVAATVVWSVGAWCGRLGVGDLAREVVAAAANCSIPFINKPDYIYPR